MEMQKQYDPKQVEERLYRLWEDNGYFVAKREEGKKPFTLMMPPPNITGQLHMGHAMDVAPQDILTRYHRMLGEVALWLPGTDHASIATEVKVVDALRAEGLTKQDLGREKYLERAWQWREEYGRRITTQLRKLGASCDWSRERFTMDEGCSKAVNEVFVRLYEKGLIYRGDRITHWCPMCKTALSDAEVEYEQKDSHLWHIRYEGEDGRYVVVATTRPETMLGDTAVAVHPEDERYLDLIGKTVTLPLMNRKIPVIADAYVDKEFGTGAVKITPAHDPNDFEMGVRHDLPVVRVMNDDGTMNGHAGQYEGQTREDCRKSVIADLEVLGLMVKIQDHSHNVGTCYRCHKVIEPLVSRQWYVKMEPLAAPAREAVRTGQVQFVPQRFEKIYFNWMDNIRDWCISRQLWWGHRIPAWHCDCGETVVARTAPEVCPKCGGALHQDEDVLDTWFSSALWPFSTLGWPEQTEDLSYFYPTNVLVTGYDIIFFWAARMIFSGIEQMGTPPFTTVYMHGLVRDAQGIKMSKSLSNGIDPLEEVEKYGADALRFSLIMGVSPGSDTRYSAEKVEAARNFCNKIWNAARFVMMHLNGCSDAIDPAALEMSDKWILTRYQQITREVTHHLDELDLGMAAQKLYDFSWSSFCDWYIELVKARLLGTDEASAHTARTVLRHVLSGILGLLHPFMPFLTEEVYSYLPVGQKSLMLSNWPTADAKLDFPQEAQEMEGVMEVMRAVRNLRAEMNVPASRKANLLLIPTDGWAATLLGATQYFEKICSASGVSIITEAPQNAASAVCMAAQVFLPMNELVDTQKELARLQKELDGIARDMQRLAVKLSNPGFLQKAPEKVVIEEKEKVKSLEGMQEALRSRMEGLMKQI